MYFSRVGIFSSWITVAMASSLQITRTEYESHFQEHKQVFLYCRRSITTTAVGHKKEHSCRAWEGVRIAYNPIALGWAHWARRLQAAQCHEQVCVVV